MAGNEDILSSNFSRDQARLSSMYCCFDERIARACLKMYSTQRDEPFEGDSACSYLECFPSWILEGVERWKDVLFNIYLKGNRYPALCRV